MQRRTFLKQSTAMLAATSLSKGGLAKSLSKPPNLLFVTVDDMNWSIPGFMGNNLGLTQHLDALAAMSHRFVRNRTTAPICQPSREAMMTGRVPHRSGALGFDPVNEGVPTLVTTLKSAGYYTAAIHKTEHMKPQSCFPWDHEVVGEERKPSEYGSAVAQAIAAGRAQHKPFFINCNINDPHRPFYGSVQATEEDHNEEGEYRVVRELKAEDVQVPSCLEDLPNVRLEFSQYCNSAQRMDLSIGRVLDALNAAEEAANTIVIFSADHGMPFPFSKATVYDNGTRTPALLSYPGMGRPRTFEDRTCNIDYMPTLLELMRVPAPTGMDGRSWVPLLRGDKGGEREFLVTHVNGVNSGAQYPMRAIQDDRYSLVFTPWSDGRTQLRIEAMAGLSFPTMKMAAGSDTSIATRVKQYVTGVPLAFYDLHEDPGQRVDLLGNLEHQKRIERMKSSMHEYMRQTQDPQLDNFELLLAGKQPIVSESTTVKTKPE